MFDCFKSASARGCDRIVDDAGSYTFQDVEGAKEEACRDQDLVIRPRMADRGIRNRKYTVIANDNKLIRCIFISQKPKNKRKIGGQL